MSYDVAIVGGGVIGWSSAWHLLRRKPGLKIVVIDPHPALQSSLRGTGGVRAQFGSKLNIELSLASIEEFLRFSEDVGHEIGFRQVGYLLVTADPAKATQMQACAQLQKEMGVPVQELGKVQIREMAPYINANDLCYGTFSPGDGLLDGPEVVRGYARAAQKLGAEKLVAKAEDITPTSVSTSGGVIQADAVVVAAGHWSGYLSVDLPVKPERHQLFQRPDSAGVPDDAPMVIDVDSSLHFRRKGEGLIVGFHDSSLACSPCDFEAVPHFDISVFFRMRHQFRDRCPHLFDGWTDIQGWGGYYTCTPDRQPILGMQDGIYIATGFGGHGVMHSPAAGRIVAEMILDGFSLIDVSSLSPARFAGDELVSEVMVF